MFKYDEKVYHGISEKLSFDMMGSNFAMPTSTTLSLIVAQRFSGHNGVILELTRTSPGVLRNCYFDVYIGFTSVGDGQGFPHVLCVDTGRSSETAKAHRG
eukprot:TRINITY_DN26969_c0_g1_i1.p1 TRINITY_DN26969_c0_g1~~TRINITY_DN26969_c0_g1_i1.p1  ORF type:complete len:100 (-),score=50.04 TRINITY_DN26969_c0_g1_i1:2-301(-)